MGGNQHGLDQALTREDRERLLEVMRKWGALDSSNAYKKSLETSMRRGFAASDLSLAERLPGTAEADDDNVRYRVQTHFLGLQGADSPLPAYYLDRMAFEQAQERGIRSPFLDFFNHRLLTLLHQSWRTHRGRCRSICGRG